MKKNAWIRPIALAGLATAVACGGQSPDKAMDDVIDLDALATSGLSGDEVTLYDIRGGRLAELRGDAALDLYAVLDAAGGVRRLERDGHAYLLGTYLACVARVNDTLCQIASADLSTSVDGFEFTVHGARGASAASELFGALARANDLRPNAVTVVESDRFVCGKDARDAWCGLSPQQSTPKRAELVMRYVGLEPLGPDYVYEGWIITSAGPISSGRFEVSQSDETFSFDVLESDARDSTAFVLTIEPKFNDDPAPAATHILAGDYSGFVSNLGVQHPAALGTFFGEAAGSFILAAPSDPNASYANGVWWLDPAGPAPTLNLPTLPGGWVYEGWVVTDRGPISTGRFTSVEGADSDGAGPQAGPEPTPPFPGQDFVNPPIDLVGATMVITVEPEPDNASGPFTMKPLAGVASDPGRPGVLQSMMNQAADTNPVGITAFFDEDGALLR